MRKLNTKKKILTLEDLYDFYFKQNKSITFSSKESGYQLSVQVPASFETDKNENQDDTLLFGTTKLFHIGRNRNKSSVTEEAAKKAMKTIAYKPLLANFCEIDGVKDFTSHDMVIDEDGNVEYLERQIGCFTADEPYMEYDEIHQKTYVYAKVAIPREYTDAVSIIERKNGTKISVELLVNELSYNSAEKVLELTDVIVQGATCLGKNPDTGEDVGEGMEGARLDIADFSKDNNSIMNYVDQNNFNSKLIDTLERLNTTLSEFNNKSQEINNAQNFSNNEKEGGSESVTKLEELLSKYNKTVDELDFEIEGLSDEELEAKFAEVFDDNSEEGAKGTDDGEGSEGEGIEDPVVNNEEDPISEGNEDPESDPAEPTGEFEENPVNDNPENPKFSKTFELSMEDIRSALYQLLEPVEQANNDWYWIVQTYDNRFIYQGCMGDYYCQKYTKDGNNVAFDGERYPVFAEFVTESEKVELDRMRSNYSSIQEELNKYKEAETNVAKEEILSDEAYAEFIETEEFKAIREKFDEYSIDEIKTACELAFAKLVKAKGNFSYAENKDKKDKKVNKIGINSSFEKNEDNNDPYGDYFKSLSARY